MVFVPKFTDPDEEKATLERVADHIDYIGKRCGRSHVGISSDFGMSSRSHFSLINSYQMVSTIQ